MKHLNSFHGSVTACLINMGLDSVKVLDAVNAFIGGIEADPTRTATKAGAKLTGTVTTKGVDKRVVTIRETEKRVAKVGYGPVPALYAINSAMVELTDRHGVTVAVSELPPEVETWLRRDSFKAKIRHAPSDVMTEVVPVHPGA